MCACSVVSESFATPWTGAQPAPLSIGFLRQKYWNRLSFPTPEDLLDPGIKPESPILQADSLPLYHQGSLYRSSQSFFFFFFFGMVRTRGSMLPFYFNEF